MRKLNKFVYSITFGGSLVLGLVLGVWFAGCGDDGGGCAGMCDKYCDLCQGGSECKKGCKEEACGGGCTMPDSVISCVNNASTCEQAGQCQEDWQDSFEGNVSSTCAEFCQKCEDCQGSGIDEGDCQDYQASPQGACMTNCEGDTYLQDKLSNLAKKVSEFSCCDLDNAL